MNAESVQRLIEKSFPVASILLATALGVVFPKHVADWTSVPLALGGLTIGMSHGAADFHLIRRARTPWVTLLFYLAIMFAAVLWWIVDATSALTVFLVLTAWHFADEEADRWYTGETAPRIERAALMLSHAAIVIGLPLMVHPVRSEAFLNLVGRVGLSSTNFSGSWQAIASVGLPAVIGLICAGLGIWAWRQRTSDVPQVVTESMLLTGAAIVLPPQFFIGMYLLVWHAPHHYQQLTDRLTQSTIAANVAKYGNCLQDSDCLRDSVYRRGSSFWRDTLVFHVPAVVAILFLTFVASRRLENVESTVVIFAAATVLTYLVVTPPHHWLGSNQRLDELGPRRPSRSSTRP